MKPLERLTKQQAQRLRGVIFDLDGTVLTGGKLTEEALAALWKMSRAGLRLVGCTGRSARWGEVLLRVLPIDGCIVENGAVGFVSTDHGIQLRDAAGEERSRREAALREVCDQLTAQFSDLHYTDDNDGRISDITFDIGERQQMPQARVDEVCAAARLLGARTFASSIHLHITLDGDDKASGTLRFLARHFGEDVTEALGRYAFVGDSGNDAACFSAFALTFGVANVRQYVAQLSRTPRYLCRQAEGAGFAEMADRILSLRGSE